MTEKPATNSVPRAEGDSIQATIDRSRELSSSIDSLQDQWAAYEATMKGLNQRFLQSVLPQYDAVKANVANDSLLEASIAMAQDIVERDGSEGGSPYANTNVGLEWAMQWTEKQEAFEAAVEEDEASRLAMALSMSMKEVCARGEETEEAEDDEDGLAAALALSVALSNEEEQHMRREHDEYSYDNGAEESKSGRWWFYVKKVTNLQ